MQPFLTFLALFPSSRVMVYEDELIYKVSTKYIGSWFEAKARRIIMDNALPLIAEMEEWRMGGVVFERTIRVKMAPEEHEVA